jgi:hypothetical protein
MSTPYNNQWALGRSLARSRWRRRGLAAGSGAQPPAPLAPEPQRQPLAVHEPPQRSSGRPVRKRPRWIDRDT